MENGLPDNGVRVLHEDRRGRIWVGTRYGGLAVIDGDSVRSFSVRDGLLSNGIWSIAEAQSGQLWIGTQAGVQSMDPSSFQLTGDPRLADFVASSCGVSGNRFAWAFSQTGTTVMDLTQPRRRLPPCPVYITRLLVNGREVPLQNDLTLAPSESNVSVDFVAIGFSSPERVRYQYRIEPTDDRWSDPTEHHTLTLAALSPGRYRLLVRAINADGVESSQAASVRFEISPILWARWWFIVIVGGVIVLGLSAVVRARVRRTLEIERLRTRIATDLHDDIGANLTRITVYADALQQQIRSGGVPAGGGNPGELLSEIGATSRDLVENMSDVVWSVDPRNDSFESLLLRMKATAGRVLEAKGIEYEISIPEEIASLTLPLDFRRNFLLVFKEALNNVLRHSAARSVRIAVDREEGWLLLSVADNGTGFKKGAEGNGLRNMQRRSEQMRGEVHIDSVSGKGTTVSLRAKLP